MNSFSSMMQKQQLLPLIQADSREDGVSIARAMRAAGLKTLEVVLRTPESFNALTEIKQTFPELNVGAGTVLNAPMFDQAAAAGADFIVTPALTPRLLSKMVDSKIPCLPGVSNTADVALAYEAGISEMKFFPAELSGGVPYLKALSSVFQKVRFCPTGGVHPGNREEYLALPNVFAVGGSWVCKPEWVKEANWETITEVCAQAI